MPNFGQRTSRLSVRKSTTHELERALGFRLNYRTSLHVFTRGSRPAAAFMHLCFRYKLSSREEVQQQEVSKYGTKTRVSDTRTLIY